MKDVCSSHWILHLICVSVQAAEKEALLFQQEEERAEQRRKAKAEKKAQKKSQKTNRAGDKRKAEDVGEDEWGEETGKGGKRMQFGIKQTVILNSSFVHLYVIFPERKRHRGEEDVSEEQMDTESGLFGRRAPPQNKTETPVARKHQQAVTEVKNTAARMPSERSDSNSVFVSNLAFNLEDPEGKMKAAFGSCGTVIQARPVFTPKGAFRGYCYVQFEDELAVQEALKLDRQEVDGRPMFVSPCVDKSKNPDFKVCTALKRGLMCFRWMCVAWMCGIFFTVLWVKNLTMYRAVL